MRKLLLAALLISPALGLAQIEIGTSKSIAPVSNAMRTMSIEPTQTVDFDGSLKQLRGRLFLTQAQQSVWADYEKSVQSYSDLFFAEKPLATLAGEPAPRQVELMVERLQNRVKAVQDISPATKALHGALNAQQQKTADLYLLASIPVFGNPPKAQ